MTHIAFASMTIESPTIDQQNLVEDLGVDFSYDICTNVSVRRVVIWTISVHIVRKGEVLFFSSVYNWKGN